jgi:hypothetical protein
MTLNIEFTLSWNVTSINMVENYRSFRIIYLAVYTESHAQNTLSLIQRTSYTPPCITTILQLLHKKYIIILIFILFLAENLILQYQICPL